MAHLYFLEISNPKTRGQAQINRPRLPCDHCQTVSPLTHKFRGRARIIAQIAGRPDLLRVQKTVFFHPIPDGHARDAQLTGGLGDIVTRAPERLLDEEPFGRG